MSVSLVENEKKQMIHATIGTVALVAGGLIYILFRTDSLLMFEWFRLLGMSNLIGTLREGVAGQSLYEWVKFNMPAALWLFSYMFIIDAVWEKEKHTVYMFFLCLLPVIAMISEMMQYFCLLPGTFDHADILSYALAILIFIILKKL